MNRLFGIKKRPPPVVPAPSLEETGGKMDSRVAALDAKIDGINREMEGYREQMKRLPPAAQSGVRAKAAQALKRRKMYEQQRDTILRQSFSIDQTRFALESVQDTHSTVQAMKGAAAALKTEHAKLNLNEIEDVQDELEDMAYMTDEINELMGRSYGVPDVNEAELDAELAGLQEDWGTGTAVTEDTEAVPDYIPNVPFPQPPNTVPVPQ